MKPVIRAFADSPDEGQGLASDMRVRWALEEAQQPHNVGAADLAAAATRQLRTLPHATEWLDEVAVRFRDQQRCHVFANLD